MFEPHTLVQEWSSPIDFPRFGAGIWTMPFCALPLTSCGSGELGIEWQPASGKLLSVSSAWTRRCLSFSFAKDRASSIDPNVHCQAHLHSMTAYGIRLRIRLRIIYYMSAHSDLRTPFAPVLWSLHRYSSTVLAWTVAKELMPSWVQKPAKIDSINRRWFQKSYKKLRNRRLVCIGLI
jgi:hypothetical protein